MNYGTYLKIEELLKLQKPLSDPEEHDEMLFIIIHQTYELWFKQLIHEFKRIMDEFNKGDLFVLLAGWKRTRTILKTLVGQLDILETMTPRSFSAFRDRLETASGFQSTQFRMLEFMLGDKRPETLKYYDESMYGFKELKASLDAPSVESAWRAFLVQRGLDASTLPKDDRKAGGEAFQDEIVRLTDEQKELEWLHESMMDFDEGLQEWRYRHVKMVERTIGNKQGTGGSKGVEFLKQRLFVPTFPDLWAIRHRY